MDLIVKSITHGATIHGCRMEMQMKRIGRYFTMLAICMFISGCGNAEEVGQGVVQESSLVSTPGSAPESVTESNQESTQNVAESTEEMEDMQEQTQNSADVEGITDTDDMTSSRFIAVKVMRNYDYYYWDEETYETLMECPFDEVYVLSEGYEKLEQAFAELNEQNDREIGGFFNDLQEEAKWIADERETEGLPAILPYVISCDIQISRSDEAIVSLILQDYFWTGGVHPQSAFIGVNYDPLTGQKLTLSDVLTDYDRFYELVLEELEAYKEELWENYVEVVKESFYPQEPGEEQISWWMDTEGITIMFNHYELACYAAGCQELFFSYDELEDMIAPQYVYRTEQAFHKLNGGEEYTLTDAEDGEKVFSYIDRFDGDTMETSLTLQCGEGILEDKIYGSLQEAYLLQNREGETYFYGETLMDNDYRMLYVYDLSGEKPVYAGSSENTFYEFYVQDTAYFPLQCRLQVLGSYDGIRFYTIGSDGLPQALEKEYRILSTPFEPLVSTVEMEVQPLTEDGQTETGTMSLPVGSRMKPVATDAESYVILELEDGSKVKLVIEIEDYQVFINGRNDWDCFEMVPYAG